MRIGDDFYDLKFEQNYIKMLFYKIIFNNNKKI